MVSLGVCNGGPLKMIALYKCVVLGKLTYTSRADVYTWLDNKSLSSSLNESQKTYALVCNWVSSSWLEPHIH